MSPKLVFLSAVLIALAMVEESWGGDWFPEPENDKDSATMTFPLGPIGAQARAVAGTREAEVLVVAPEGPGAKSGLLVGDVITHVGGKRLKEFGGDSSTGGEGPPRMIGLALLDAQENEEALELQVDRDETKIELDLELPPLPAFEKDFPMGCARSGQLLENSADWLVRSQDDSGAFPGGFYSSAFSGLALLATGESRYVSRAKLTAEFFDYQIQSSGVPDSNWHACASGIFLAEYMLATGDESPLASLRKCCEALVQRVDQKTGRLGHSGSDLPYGGKGLVVTSAHAHLMWALAEKVGVPIDEDAWKLSYRSVEESIGSNGAVGYNFSIPGGDNQSMPRTGAMATALAVSERSKSHLRGMLNWISDTPEQLVHGHAQVSLSWVFGTMAMANGKPNEFFGLLEDNSWVFSLAQPYDASHGAYYVGSRGNIGGDSYLGYRQVANYSTVLMLAAASDRTLWSFGNRTKEWAK